MKDAILPGLPIDLIRQAYASAPGNEIESGKFLSPESSAALVANTFGLFLNQADRLPALPAGQAWGWPASSLRLEALVRFPWRGGHHPCLDVLIATPLSFIGVEAKRYEPFRPKSQVDPVSDWSKAYWRHVWGEDMQGYQRVRDALREATLSFSRLDAVQLVKHAFGLRTAVHRKGEMFGKQAVLLYLYAEPELWPNGRHISPADHKLHRDEVTQFANLVFGDEVAFQSCTYRELFTLWRACDDEMVRAHAGAVSSRFSL